MNTSSSEPSQGWFPGTHEQYYWDSSEFGISLISGLQTAPNLSASSQGLSAANCLTAPG